MRRENKKKKKEEEELIAFRPTRTAIGLTLTLVSASAWVVRQQICYLDDVRIIKERETDIERKSTEVDHSVTVVVSWCDICDGRNCCSDRHAVYTKL